MFSLVDPVYLWRNRSAQVLCFHFYRCDAAFRAEGDIGYKEDGIGLARQIQGLPTSKSPTDSGSEPCRSHVISACLSSRQQRYLKYEDSMASLRKKYVGRFKKASYRSQTDGEVFAGR
jgi:hypothetical protein